MREVLDFRFLICDLGSLARGDSRSGHDRSQFGCFPAKGFYFWFAKEACIDDQLEPKFRFVGLFFNDAKLRDELRFRASPAGGAVICSNGGSTSDQLGAERTAFHSFGQCTNKSNHAQGELFCPPLKFDFVHRSEVRVSIENRKSKIENERP